jgi:hypothetical protein
MSKKVFIDTSLISDHHHHHHHFSRVLKEREQKELIVPLAHINYQ